MCNALERWQPRESDRCDIMVRLVVYNKIGNRMINGKIAESNGPGTAIEKTFSWRQGASCSVRTSNPAKRGHVHCVTRTYACIFGVDRQRLIQLFRPPSGPSVTHPIRGVSGGSKGCTTCRCTHPQISKNRPRICRRCPPTLNRR